MLIIHDESGMVISLQTYPETTEQPHIVVDDSFFSPLQNLVDGKIRLELVDGVFVLPTNIDEKINALTLANSISEALARIEQMQADEFQRGVNFMFGSVADTIQTRSERDLINISGIATKAMLLKAKGVDQAVIEFRAESNTSYLLTPDEAIALGEAVADRNQQIYSKAWQLKDAINAAQSISELEAIQW